MHILTSIYAFLDAVPTWITALTGLVSAASAVTALTPTPKDDKVLAGVVGMLNIIALNVGHSRRPSRGE